MARVSIDILGISELKWTGIGEFNNSDDHYITIVGKNPSEEMDPKQKLYPVVDVTGDGSKV